MRTVLEVTEAYIDKITLALWEYQGKKTFADQYGVGGRPAWTRDQIEETVARVNRGALLLDKENPGWVESILPANLRMDNSSFCVIGQIYGNYDEYIGVPFGMGEGPLYREAEPQAVEHGFLTEQDDEDDDSIPYPLLDRVWVAMLTERHARQEPVVLRLPPSEPFNEVHLLLNEAGLIDLDSSYALRIPGEA